MNWHTWWDGLGWTWQSSSWAPAAASWALACTSLWLQVPPDLTHTSRSVKQVHWSKLLNDYVHQTGTFTSSCHSLDDTVSAWPQLTNHRTTLTVNNLHIVNTDCEYKSNCAPSIPPYKRQNDMEEHCSKHGLPERIDIMFVAGTLSQVKSSNGFPQWIAAPNL